MIRKLSLLLIVLSCFAYVSCAGGSSATTKPAAAPAKADQGTGPNLALGKPSTCSSFEKANQYNGGADSVAKLGNDGDLTTRWASDYQNDKDPNSAWWYVDFEQPTAIQTIKIIWEPAMAKVYDIESSDDAQTWTVIYSEKANGSKVNQIKLDSPVTARYIRVNCKARATAYGYSFWEFQAYAK